MNLQFTDKYKALAASSPRGLLLQQLVEDNWLAWISLCSTAPWIRYWSKSDLYYNASTDKLLPATRPSGQAISVETLRSIATTPQAQIALAIYVEAVWGFGMETWVDAFQAETRILALQKSRRGVVPKMLKNTWNADCDAIVPKELDALDCWLNPYWQEVLGG